MTPLLRVRDLVKTGANREPLLTIAEFTIPAGACILLSGRNGAGKTTLLKILGGLEPPDQARVEYMGEALSWPQARRRFRHDVIYLHQTPYLFDCDVAANVAYGLRGNGRSRTEIANRVAQSLATAGLAHLAARNARELSGGEKQRVAITRALVLAPRLLLLDEPLASLDEESRRRTCRLLRDLKSQRLAVVLSSHEPLALAELTDYHYRLDAGQLRQQAPAVPATVIALDAQKRRFAKRRSARPPDASGGAADERH
jgi:tungstate transport system ATP-binding protein